MDMNKSLSLLVVPLIIAACGADKPPADTAAAKVPPAGTIVVPNSNVFSPLVQDLNKAKQVNNQVQQQGQQANQQIETETAPPATTAANP
jgi:conjugal transfer/entry exclusion protein